MTKIQQQLIIDRQWHGARLDQALTSELRHFSRNQVQNFIKDGTVSINQETVTSPKRRLQQGDCIHINICIQLATHTNLAQNLHLNIAFEDEHLIIIDKKAGQVVHPGAGNPDGTLVNALLHHDRALESLPRAGLIHRLDKDTSGLIIAAKTQECFHKLVGAMKIRAIGRCYQAVVIGAMISGGQVDAPIGRDPKHRTRMSVQLSGKHAVTDYRIIQRFSTHTHIHLKLHTGRTHQIRVHMNHIHFPIVGDPTYKKQAALKRPVSDSLAHTLQAFKRQALHATELRFHHPISNAPLSLSSSLPKDMQQLIEQLKKEQASSDL